MLVRDFSSLPDEMQSVAVREYYDSLSKKRGYLLVKRVFDVALSLLLLLLLSPVFLVAAAAIKLDSAGPVFYRQRRVTAEMREFRIFKFRSMTADADSRGPLVTLENDARITRVGSIIRKGRIDELPQLINVLTGDMTFVGTRPEVEKYVARYTDEMRATLLLPAGITSEASIRFKDEAEMLKDAADVDEIYAERILPVKMRYNLDYLKGCGIGRDIAILFRTLFAVM